MMLNHSICRQWWCLNSHVRSLKSYNYFWENKKYKNQFQWTSKAAGKDSDNSFLMPCIFYSDRNLFKNILFPFFSCASTRTNPVRGVSSPWKCFYFYYRRAREKESQPPLCGVTGEICKLSAFVIFLTFFILLTVKNLFSTQLLHVEEGKVSEWISDLNLEWRKGRGGTIKKETGSRCLCCWICQGNNGIIGKRMSRDRRGTCVNTVISLRTSAPAIDVKYFLHTQSEVGTVLCQKQLWQPM